MGKNQESRTCLPISFKPCPIDGNWIEWSPWSKCDPSCGEGLEIRRRTCSDPIPQNGGAYCAGSNSDSRTCYLTHCPIDGNWDSWSTWSNCDSKGKCGHGTRRKIRKCANPSPAYGGSGCDGLGQIVDTCYTSMCLDEWSNWLDCDSTCGRGIRLRVRSGDVEQKFCFNQPCPVDGIWTSWSDWTCCTQTCSLGFQRRTRDCTNPAPKDEGVECEGIDEEQQQCYLGPCPIDGGWAQWSNWLDCSASCGEGYQSRDRRCTNPPSEHGGAHCSGNSWETYTCNPKPCLVGGKWSLWSNWVGCEGTCGGGHQKRSRTCSNPMPQHGGAQCDGISQQHQECNTPPCPIDGGLTQWTEWTSCPVSCGDSHITRARKCINPSPQYGGSECLDNRFEIQTCHYPPCPVDGKWSTWSNWMSCDATCGVGNRRRSRTCSVPAPILGGATCEGNEWHTQDCEAQPCPIDGSWMNWIEWSSCSVTCGGGTQTRTRNCSDSAYGGFECSGNNLEQLTCNDVPCFFNFDQIELEIGGDSWQNWLDWTGCPVTCGGGHRTRSRSCSIPNLEDGSSACVGNSLERVTCNDEPCSSKYRQIQAQSVGFEIKSTRNYLIIQLSLFSLMLLFSHNNLSL